MTSLIAAALLLAGMAAAAPLAASAGIGCQNVPYEYDVHGGYETCVATGYPGDGSCLGYYHETDPQGQTVSEECACPDYDQNLVKCLTAPQQD